MATISPFIIRISPILFRFAGLLFLLFTVPSYSEVIKSPPQIQLATVYQQTENIEEYWISEKLDGVRGYWDGKYLFTRQGNQINVPNFFTEGWPKEPLDGELWLTHEQFEEISALVRTKNPDSSRWKTVKFMIFDMPKEPGTFTTRIKKMRELVSKNQSPNLDIITQYRVNSLDDLEKELLQVVDLGGEGLMLHHQDALYTVGRSKQIMKLKPFLDAEAKVIAVIMGKGKYQGKMGALYVQTPDRLRFKIGTGFSDNDRENPPQVGDIITFKYSGTTKFSTPRFASYLRIRESVSDHP